MVALTYGDTRVSGVETKTATTTVSKNATAAAPAKSWFARFLAAMMEARMRQAEREIRLYAPQILPLLPALRRAQAAANDGDTPRGGW
jgi:hypothetical protein